MTLIKEEDKKSEPLINDEDVKEKSEPKKVELLDEYVFIQCESSSYIIEKSLGPGEKMNV